jgi:hypothetical protein
MSEEKAIVTLEAPVRSKPLPLEFPGVHYYYYDDQEIEAALSVLRSRSLFRYYGVDLQIETEKFEEEFARAVGTRHALGLASGTSALSAALSALGVGPGQEVIVPAYVWVSVIAAVVNVRKSPKPRACSCWRAVPNAMTEAYAARRSAPSETWEFSVSGEQEHELPARADAWSQTTRNSIAVHSRIMT